MAVGETKDAGWEIGVSRTVPISIDEAWARVEDPTAWLGEEPDDVRSRHDREVVRVGWKGTVVQVRVKEAATGTTVSFHQEHLASAEEREQQRGHWTEVLDRLFG